MCENGKSVQVRVCVYVSVCVSACLCVSLCVSVCFLFVSLCASVFVLRVCEQEKGPAPVMGCAADQTVKIRVKSDACRGGLVRKAHTGVPRS